MSSSSFEIICLFVGSLGNVLLAAGELALVGEVTLPLVGDSVLLAERGGVLQILLVVSLGNIFLGAGELALVVEGTSAVDDDLLGSREAAQTLLISLSKVLLGAGELTLVGEETSEGVSEGVSQGLLVSLGNGLLGAGELTLVGVTTPIGVVVLVGDRGGVSQALLFTSGFHGFVMRLSLLFILRS